MPKKYIASISVVDGEELINHYEIKVDTLLEAYSHCEKEVLKSKGHLDVFVSDTRLNREDG